MKLFSKITRHAYLKYMKQASGHYSKLVIGSKLKPGDLIQTCDCFNTRIKTIDPIVYTSSPTRSIYAPFSRREGWFIWDFHIVDIAGREHSWRYCCGPPISTSELEKAFELKNWNLNEGSMRLWTPRTKSIYERLHRNEPVWDKDGIYIEAEEIGPCP